MKKNKTKKRKRSEKNIIELVAKLKAPFIDKNADLKKLYYEKKGRIRR